MAPARRVVAGVRVCLVALLLPALAAAQDPPAAGQAPLAPGSVIVQQVENGPAAGFGTKYVNVGGQNAL